MENLFCIFIIIILYTYVGYAILLFIIAELLKIFRRQRTKIPFTPSLTLVVAAYNEEDCIEEKIQNSLSLDYPPGLLQFIFVTDGSVDATPTIVAKYPEIKLLHGTVRNGKAAAIHRAMQQVQTETVVFTDANAMLNKNALLFIAAHYQDTKTGAVAGEKRVDTSGVTDAMAGEGIYWRYESFVKRSEAVLHSVVGAAGELFSIRTALYEPLPPDTIVDDLMLTMKIAAKGYRIRYEPRAYATEKTSAGIQEERKRKVRIAAGGIQAMVRLPGLLLPYPYPLLWFEYISHRILRWVVAPYLLMPAFFLNMVLVYRTPANTLLIALLAVQGIFYLIALAGLLLRKRQHVSRLFFLPYYFCLMNYGMMEGMLRYISGTQTVAWEKAVRR